MVSKQIPYAMHVPVLPGVAPLDSRGLLFPSCSFGQPLSLAQHDDGAVVWLTQWELATHLLANPGEDD
eukprot:12791537-Alexandrium_andersonii.AAC.1